MKVVIMAGGKGTRISSVASDIPKPMIKVEGIPVLEREIECLKNQGFDDIILTVSHLGNIIMDYFGDGSGNSPVTGEPFGVHIDYYFEEEPLGNAGALFKIKDKGMKVIGLTGARNSKLEQMSDVCIKVPQTETYMIQELHLPVYHCLCLMLEERFFGEKN